MSEVPIRRTPLSPARAESILRQTELRPSAIRLLLALWDLETAAGGSMYNHNWGNMVVGDHPGHPYYVADDSGNLRRFRAYDSAAEGAADWLRQLFRADKPWAEGLATGDPKRFARALKAGGYYEAPLERYTRTLVERWRKYPHLQDRKPQRRRAKPSAGSGAALVLLLAGIGAIAWRFR